MVSSFLTTPPTTAFDRYIYSLSKSPYMNYLNHLQDKLHYYFKIDHKNAVRIVSDYFQRLPIQYTKHNKDINENIQEWLVYSLLHKFPITSNIDPEEFPKIFKKGGNFYFTKRMFKDKFVEWPLERFTDLFISLYLFTYYKEDPTVFKTVILAYINKYFRFKDHKQRYVIQSVIELLFVFPFKVTMKKRIRMRNFYSALIYFGRGIKYKRNAFYAMMTELGLIKIYKTNFSFTRRFYSLYYTFLLDIFRRFDLIRSIDYKTYRRLDFLDFK